MSRALFASAPSLPRVAPEKIHLSVLNFGVYVNFPAILLCINERGALCAPLRMNAKNSRSGGLALNFHYTPKFNIIQMNFFEATRRKERSKKLLEHKAKFSLRGRASFKLLFFPSKLAATYNVRMEVLRTLRRLCEDAEACGIGSFSPLKSFLAIFRRKVATKILTAE